MSHDLDHVLAARMNAEPPIFRGCSASELTLVAGVATVFWLPVAIIVAMQIGAVAIGLAGMLIVATVYFGAGFFLKIKRGRPDGYYQHRIDLGLRRLGFRRSHIVVLKEGMPRLGRTWSR